MAQTAPEAPAHQEEVGSGKEDHSPLLNEAEEVVSSGDLCRFCITAFLVVVGFGITMLLALSRNYHCNPESLAALTPPYEGDLVPKNLTMLQRKGWFQLSKLVDVYDATDDTHVGYFYDLNLPFVARFGFSDASDRIWFEARTPIWWHLGDLFYLQRCDAGANGKHAVVYKVEEDFQARTWFCFANCNKRFHLSKSGGGAGALDVPLANAAFDSTLQPYVAFKSSFRVKGRKMWFMNMTEAQGSSVIALAQQHFELRLLGSPLSRWVVEIQREEPELPNWVVAFMAALDDLEETER